MPGNPYPPFYAVFDLFNVISVVTDACFGVYPEEYLQHGGVLSHLSTKACGRAGSYRSKALPINITKNYLWGVVLIKVWVHSGSSIMSMNSVMVNTWPQMERRAWNTLILAGHRKNLALMINVLVVLKRLQYETTNHQLRATETKFYHVNHCNTKYTG